MTTILNIAGHGKRKNGTFDGGAYGYMTMGEHRYIRDHLFPAMKKYVPNGVDMKFHTAYNVFSYGNIVNLAKQYGDDTIVIEWHFDAFTSSARGGHVIVYGGYLPDSLDLALRDVIESMVGVRYRHKGHKGISGRYNLANVNRTAKGSVNYRLVELGFGTNRTDANIMLNRVDEYAKKLVQAIVGDVLDKDVEVKQLSVSEPKSDNIASKSVDQLANEVIQGHYGAGNDRKKALGSRYDEVQTRVNQLLTGKSSPKQSTNEVARDVLAGKYGNGANRERNLEAAGYNYRTVQNEVNRLLGAGNIKSVDTLAREVIDGKWGNGTTRRNRLIGAGYDYNAIQRRVNQLV